jgi:hypothetical protein
VAHYCDPTTKKLDNFLFKEAEPILRAVLSKNYFSNASTFLSRPFLDSLNEPIAPIDETLQNLEQAISEICRRQKREAFLLLFRKIPVFHLNSITKRLLSDSSESYAVSGLIQDAILFGTNAILKFSVADPFEKYATRYEMEASEIDFQNSHELAILCLLHRALMYRRNSLARRNLVEAVSFELLLEVYNQRLVRNHQKQKLTKMPALILPGALVNPVLEPLSFHREDSDYSIDLRSFVPSFVDPSEELERYAYMDGEAFFKETEVAFDSAWKIWVALNQVLAERMIFHWSQEYIEKIDEKSILRGIDEADDFTETCIGGGRRTSLIKKTKAVLEKAKEWDAAQGCQKFINYLTFNEFDTDIRFIEQPFLFYAMGEDLFLWDYLRHGGFMKAISRRIKRGGGSMGELAGEGFEIYIEKRLGRLHTVKGIKRNMEFKKRKSLSWEIDLGFVVSDILVLVEAKHEAKPLRYHFADENDISDRVSTFEGRLARLDEKIKEFKDEIFLRWKSEDLVGTIGLICTLEVEFVASCSPNMWLEFARTPRIMTVDELVEYVQKNSLSFESHPEFVRF